MTPSPLRRRQFLQSAAPFFVPGAAALGLNGATAASDRIVMAKIGQGARGRFVLGHFLDQKDVQFVAVCDCCEARRKMAKEIVDSRYRNSACAAYQLHQPGRFRHC